MKTYTITTDGAMMVDIRADNVADAIAAFGECPDSVKTAEDFEQWLRENDGYGHIDEDGDRIANVSDSAG